MFMYKMKVLVISCLNKFLNYSVLNFEIIWILIEINDTQVL